MIINSLSFLIFFFVLCLIYFNVNQKFKQYLLLASSIVFYLFAGIFGLVIIVLLTLVNYFTGIAIEKSVNKNSILLLSCVINIGSLILFKYYNVLNDGTFLPAADML